MQQAPPMPPVPKLPVEGRRWEDWLRLLRGVVNYNADQAYVVAMLPSPTAANNPPNIAVPFEGQMAYALDGRKVGEGAGTGTGVPCYFSNGLWRVFSTDAQVLA